MCLTCCCCCVVGLISFFSWTPYECVIQCVWVDESMCWQCLDIAIVCIITVLQAKFPSRGKKKELKTEMTWTVLNVEDHWLVCYFYPLSTLIREKRQWWLFCLFSLSPTFSDYEAWVVWRCWLGIAEHIVYTFMAFWIGRPPAQRDTISCKHTNAHTESYYTRNMYPYLSAMCIYSTKPVCILLSSHYCLGQEYSWSMLHTLHLLVELTNWSVWESKMTLKWWLCGLKKKKATCKM